MTSLIIVTYFFLGLCALAVGSFLNVMIYRLPFMLKTVWIEECQCLLKLPIVPLNDPLQEINPSVNLFFPRSFCPHCKGKIKSYHNIPIISFILLNRQCAYCHQAISWRYPIVEFLSCLLALIAFSIFGPTLSFGFSLLFIWLVIPMIIIDYEHQLLPDSLTLTLLWLGLIANTQNLWTSLPDAVLSAAGAYLFLWLFIKLFYLLTKKVGMGHGDLKLFAALGAWFGARSLPMILLCSSLTGLIAGIIWIKYSQQSKETPIPFGPFLCIAGLICLFSRTVV